MTIPTLIKSAIPDHQKLHLWHGVFELGKSQAPFLAVTALALHLTTGYLRNRTIKSWRLAAAGLTIAIVPFTGTLMGATNDAMIRGTVEGIGGLDVAALLTKWASLNLTRSLLPLLGGAIGLWCSRNEV